MGGERFAVKQLVTSLPLFKGNLFVLEETIPELLQRLLALQNFRVDGLNARTPGQVGFFTLCQGDMGFYKFEMVSGIFLVSVRGRQRSVKACQLYLDPKSPVFWDLKSEGGFYVLITAWLMYKDLHIAVSSWKTGDDGKAQGMSRWVNNVFIWLPWKSLSLLGFMHGKPNDSQQGSLVSCDFK